MQTVEKLSPGRNCRLTVSAGWKNHSPSGRLRSLPSNQPQGARAMLLPPVVPRKVEPILPTFALRCRVRPSLPLTLIVMVL